MNHCCDRMNQMVAHTCEQHPDPFDCPDALIQFSRKFREYGMIIHDGGSSIIRILFCPFCGKKLAESKRDEWFETLEGLGFEDPSGDDIPEEFKTEAWYSNETE